MHEGGSYAPELILTRLDTVTFALPLTFRLPKKQQLVPGSRSTPVPSFAKFQLGLLSSYRAQKQTDIQKAQNDCY